MNILNDIGCKCDLWGYKQYKDRIEIHCIWRFVFYSFQKKDSRCAICQCRSTYTKCVLILFPLINRGCSQLINLHKLLIPQCDIWSDINLSEAWPSQYIVQSTNFHIPHSKLLTSTSTRTDIRLHYINESWFYFHTHSTITQLAQHKTYTRIPRNKHQEAHTTLSARAILQRHKSKFYRFIKKLATIFTPSTRQKSIYITHPSNTSRILYIFAGNRRPPCAPEAENSSRENFYFLSLSLFLSTTQESGWKRLHFREFFENTFLLLFRSKVISGKKMR